MKVLAPSSKKDQEFASPAVPLRPAKSRWAIYPPKPAGELLGHLP